MVDSDSGFLFIKTSSIEKHPNLEKIIMTVETILVEIRSFLQGEQENLWIVDESVWWDGDEDLFRTNMNESTADFLGTLIRTSDQDPNWPHWKTLVVPNGESPPPVRLAALLPLLRLSRAAASLIQTSINAGWAGHPEVLIPTLMIWAGLVVEEIGGGGTFTPSLRVGLWYNEKTFKWQGPVHYEPGKIHYPVARNLHAIAEPRYKASLARTGKDQSRILYVSPVGGAAKDLIEPAVQLFGSSGAHLLLLQYDNTPIQFNDACEVIHDHGQKWQLAHRHLRPDLVAEYDYIFYWDDDLALPCFDPRHFTHIMATNGLSMAQPGIQSQFGLSHAITEWRPLPPPWRDAQGRAVRRIVGRLTNFVEIMAPVFTREAWKEFYAYLTPDNLSGWGYDYIPLGRKGVVDLLPVTHTRAVQSASPEAAREMSDFLNCQGLLRFAPVNMGWLFD